MCVCECVCVEGGVLEVLRCTIQCLVLSGGAGGGEGCYGAGFSV